MIVLKFRKIRKYVDNDFVKCLFKDYMEVYRVEIMWMESFFIIKYI